MLTFASRKAAEFAVEAMNAQARGETRDIFLLEIPCTGVRIIYYVLASEVFCVFLH